MHAFLTAECRSFLFDVPVTAVGDFELLGPSRRRIGVIIVPQQNLLAVDTRKLTSAMDGMTIPSIPFTFSLWEHGQIVQQQWRGWAAAAGKCVVGAVMLPEGAEIMDFIGSMDRKGGKK